ncbi:isopentenyl-diphosphate Delta-isomerase [Flavobacteriales bacterium]|jgi:isopentenyl-diphosphate delta-isomerase|nr:isopentenyl-diphosphate Delta-isomerase [Flavobacteriales bacterium]
MEEHVVLVNTLDQNEGTMEKMEAHRVGRLHRAFSVFILNSRGELLLQQRAHHKYHSGGLWTNTCCSHPREGEDTIEAGQRRLTEEMGMQCQLEKGFDFIYRSELDGGLVEHEFDHVLFGMSDVKPTPNPDEVAGYRYVSFADLRLEMSANPNGFTTWFRICFERAADHLKK